MNSRIVARVALLLAWLAPWPAAAFVTCTFSSTPGLAFGPYDDASPLPANGATSVVARCFRLGGSSDANVTLQIGPSANSGSIAARQLRSGANPMNYNLYRDAARMQVWGQTAGVDTVSVSVTGIPNFGTRNASFTIYGRIPALESVPVGAYSDSVQLTVSP